MHLVQPWLYWNLRSLGHVPGILRQSDFGRMHLLYWFYRVILR